MKLETPFNHTRKFSNMSCRSRTTVNSKPLNSETIFVGTGTANKMTIPLDLSIFDSEESSKMLEENPDWKIAYWNAKLEIESGYTQEYIKNYEDRIFNSMIKFMESKSLEEHTGELITKLKITPPPLKLLPVSAIVLSDRLIYKRSDMISDYSDFFIIIFLMAHSNRTVYLRNKTPILSNISRTRKSVICFYQNEEV